MSYLPFFSKFCSTFFFFFLKKGLIEIEININNIEITNENNAIIIK